MSSGTCDAFISAFVNAPQFSLNGPHQIRGFDFKPVEAAMRAGQQDESNWKPPGGEDENMRARGFAFKPVQNPPAPEIDVDEILRKKIAAIRESQKGKELLKKIKAKMVATSFTNTTIFRMTYPRFYREEILEELENLGFAMRSSPNKSHLYWSLSPFSSIQDGIAEYVDMDL